jgi:hypothetical protein
LRAAGRYLNTFNFDGWSLSDVRVDYSRMGLDTSKDWQVRVYQFHLSIVNLD